MNNQQEISQFYQKIKCTVEGHHNFSLAFICLSKDCQSEQSLLCQLCVLSRHSSHVNNIINIQQLVEDEEDKIINWPLEQEKNFQLRFDSPNKNKFSKKQQQEEFQSKILEYQNQIQENFLKFKMIIEEMLQNFEIQTQNLIKQIDIDYKDFLQTNSCFQDIIINPRHLIDEYKDVFNLQSLKNIILEFAQSKINLSQTQQNIKNFVCSKERSQKLEELNNTLQLQKNKKIELLQQKNNQQNEFLNTVQFSLKQYIQKIDSIKISLQINDLQIDSQIIENSDIKLLNKWFKPTTQFTLLYRASVDGFGSAEFHQKCDKKGSTLTLVKTTDNQRIGGYTDIIWRSRNGSYGEGSNNFIFSLNNQKQYFCNNLEYAIYDHLQYGPTFGSGHDLFISNDSDKNQNSSSSLHRSYGNGNQIDNTELIGNQYFTTSEIEVFLVTI